MKLEDLSDRAIAFHLEFLRREVAAYRDRKRIFPPGTPLRFVLSLGRTTLSGRGSTPWDAS
jgi:hypothetical protein